MIDTALSALAALMLTPATQASAPAEGAAPEKRICKRVGTTSTRLPRERLCLTAEGWEEHAREQTEYFENGSGKGVCTRTDRPC